MNGPDNLNVTCAICVFGWVYVSVVCFAIGVIGCGESIPVLVYRVRSRAYRVSGGMQPTKGVPERYQDAMTTT